MKKSSLIGRKYRQTALPNEWKLNKLSQLGSLISGLHLNPVAYNSIGKGIPYFTGPTDYTTDLNRVSKWTEQTAALSQKFDLLVTVKGSGVGSLHKQVFDRVAIGRQIVAFRANSNSDTDFIRYAVDAKRYLLQSLAKGNMIPGLSRSDLLTLSIVTPPIAEQKAIARVLGLMDDVIDKNNQLIAQKELRKKWLMQNLLTGKKRLKGFSGEWSLVRLSEIFQEVFRYVEWSDHETYELASIRRRFGGLFNRGATQGNNIEVKCLKRVQEDDFLISRRQVSHGAWARVPSSFDGYCVSDEYDCLEIRDSERLDSNFWGWFCQDRALVHKAYISSNGVHIEKLILDLSSFLKHTVSVPRDRKEQVAIARVLNAANSELIVLTEKRKALKSLKQWLMQQLLTGKKRLK